MRLCPNDPTEVRPPATAGAGERQRRRRYDTTASGLTATRFCSQPGDCPHAHASVRRFHRVGFGGGRAVTRRTLRHRRPSGGRAVRADECRGGGGKEEGGRGRGRREIRCDRRDALCRGAGLGEGAPAAPRQLLPAAPPVRQGGRKKQRLGFREGRPHPAAGAPDRRLGLPRLHGRRSQGARRQGQRAPGTRQLRPHGQRHQAHRCVAHRSSRR